MVQRILSFSLQGKFCKINKEALDTFSEIVKDASNAGHFDNCEDGFQLGGSKKKNKKK